MEVRLDAMKTEEPKQYSIPENKRIQRYKAKFAA